MNFTLEAKNMRSFLTQLKNDVKRSVEMELVIQLFLYSINNEQDPYRRYMKEIRQMEIDECFGRNLFHPLIQTIHILCDTLKTKQYYENLATKLGQQMKCVFVFHGKQPTYAEIVEYVSKNIHSNKIVCIQNSDIYIDHSLSKEFLEKSVTPNAFVSLTRHEHTDDTHSKCDVTTCPLIWDYQGSHDTFLFRTPVPETFDYKYVSIPQNVYGAEAIFMKAWKDTGKTLFNPCFDISIYHRHMNRVSFEQYKTVADGYLCHVSPTAPEARPELQNQLKTIFKD